jgi:hypothetical protein
MPVQEGVVMETPIKIETFVLKSVDGAGKDLSIEVTAGADGYALLIRPKGFGDNGSMPGFGTPLMVENRGGVPFVCVWDDINREDTSHVISLEKAAEDKYGEVDPGSRCQFCGGPNH